MAEQPPTKKRRLTGDIITLVVGKEGSTENIKVHESLLKERPTFFEAALKNGWKEHEEGVIRLSEDEPDVVAAYIEWLYSRNIILPQPSGRPPQDIPLKENVHYAKLYVFGEKNQDIRFCNGVLATWVDRIEPAVPGSAIRKLPGPEAVRVVYEGTPEDSPARKMLVELYATCGCAKWLEPLKPGDDRRPILLQVPEFLLDLAHRQMPLESKGTFGFAAQKAQWLRAED